MAKEDIVTYLANIVSASRAEGKINPLEEKALEEMCEGIGARRDDLEKALKAVGKGHYKPTPVGRFSDKVRNLEDMIYISVSDEKLPASQKKVILSFAKEIKVSQAQINEILYESKKRIKLQRGEVSCSSCGKEIPPNSKFCPYCGSKC
jgi:hypothetical protein